MNSQLFPHETFSTTVSSSPTISPSDHLHFGHLWPAIRQYTKTHELDTLILERKREISSLKEQWRPFIKKMSSLHGPWHTSATQLQQILKHGKLVSSVQGGGSAYFLFDAKKIPRYVIKPFDEDFLCLHNRKNRASPFRDSHYRVRSSIPLYETLQREFCASIVASILGIPDITPPTTLAIIESATFYDISEALDESRRRDFIQRTGTADKEKLCSVQPFLLDAIDLGEALHEWFEAGLENKDTPLPIEQESYEDANLLMWVTYDCDGHGSNFLLYLHSLDEKGHALYGIKKIDNGLCFPVVNKYLLNYLAYLPNAKQPLSPRLCTKISHINSAAICEHLSTSGLEDVIGATMTRISVLKALAKRPSITLEEVNLRMELLAIPRGEYLALSSCTKEELEQLALEKDLPIPSLHSTCIERLHTTHALLPLAKWARPDS